MEIQNHVQLLSPAKNYPHYFAAICRRHRKVGADSAICLVAGCHGGPDAGERAHPCGHHGHGGRIHDGAAPFPLRLSAGDVGIDRCHRRGDGVFRRHRGPRAKRHQASFGLLHGEPAWLYVSRCRMGAFSAAIFHLFTHAFFKACLFLGSGSVIHALGGEQDMRKMGGLKAYHADHLLDLCDSDLGHRRHRHLPRAFSQRISSSGNSTVAREDPPGFGSLAG